MAQLGGVDEAFMDSLCRQQDIASTPQELSPTTSLILPMRLMAGLDAIGILVSRRLCLMCRNHTDGDATHAG